MATSDISGHILEGDGLVSNIFAFLWKRRAALQFDANHTATHELEIPSSVIYEHNYPKAWYYQRQLSSGGGEVERKLGKDIDSYAIFQAMLKPSDSAVVAAKSRDDERPSEGNTHNRPEATTVLEETRRAALTGGSVVVASYFSNIVSDGEPTVGVEYLDQAQLAEFLFRRTKRADGVLQKWTEPAGKFNTVIQVIWTPHVCLVSRRMNKTAIRDSRASFFERCVTFDGPSHYSSEAFVAPHVHWQVEHVCKEVVTYLFNAHNLALRRMVLHFKVDRLSRLWFLWASSVRAQGKVGLNLTVRYVQPVITEDGEIETRRKPGSGVSSLSLVSVAQMLDESKPLDEIEYDRKMKPPTIEVAEITQNGSMRKLSPQRQARLTADGPHFPKPPSMGPIGTLYVTGSITRPFTAPAPPRKTRRRKQARAAQGEPETTEPVSIFARRCSLGKAEALPESLPTVPKPPSSRKSSSTATSGEKRRKSKRRSSAQQLERIATGLDNIMRLHRGSSRTTFVVCPAKRTPRNLWPLVRMFVLSSTFNDVRAGTDGKDWLSSLSYRIYSHFLSSSQPMELVVPSFMCSIGPFESPVEWLAACGIAASVDRPPPRTRSNSSFAFTPSPSRAPAELYGCAANAPFRGTCVFVTGLHAPLAVVSNAVDTLCKKYVKSLVHRGRWMALGYWVLDLCRRSRASNKDTAHKEPVEAGLPAHPSLAPPDVLWSSSEVTSTSFQIPES